MKEWLFIIALEVARDYLWEFLFGDYWKRQEEEKRKIEREQQEVRERFIITEVDRFRQDLKEAWSRTPHHNPVAVVERKLGEACGLYDELLRVEDVYLKSRAIDLEMKNPWVDVPPRHEWARYNTGDYNEHVRRCVESERKRLSAERSVLWKNYKEGLGGRNITRAFKHLPGVHLDDVMRHLYGDNPALNYRKNSLVAWPGDMLSPHWDKYAEADCDTGRED